MHQSEFAQALAQALRLEGVEPRIENLKAACGWDYKKLQREIRSRYKYVIPTLSASYMSDEFLATELLQALVIEQLTKTTYVLPVLVEECYVHPPLQARVVDFRHEAFENAFARLNARLTDSRQAFVAMKFGDDQPILPTI